MKFAFVFFFAAIFAFAMANPVLDQPQNQPEINQNISTAELNQILKEINPFTLRDAAEIQERLKNVPLENTTVTQ